MANIQDLTETWEGHTHAEVEDFIKAQIAELRQENLNSLKVLSVGSTAQTYTSSQSEVVTKYRVSNLRNNVFDPNFTVRYLIGEDVLFEETPKVGSELDEITSGNLAPYFAKYAQESLILTIQAYTAEKEANLNIRFTRKEANVFINKTFNRIDPNYINIDAQFTTQNAVLHVKFYGVIGSITANQYKEVTKELYTSGSINIEVPNTDTYGGSGAHLIEAFVELDDGTLSESDTVNFISTRGANIDDIFIIYDEIVNAIQNDVVDINYIVYRANKTATEQYDVQFIKNNEVLVNQVTSNGKMTNYKYRVPEIDNTIYIKVENVRYPIKFKAEPTRVSWSITPGSELYFNAEGRSNTDSNKDEWKSTIGSKVYEAVFENFPFNYFGGGWSNNEALRIIGNNKLYIKDFYPLYDTTQFVSGLHGGGLLNEGFTLMFSFNLLNFSDPNVRFIECVDENGLGFYVTGNGFYINISSNLSNNPNDKNTPSHNSRSFSLNTRVDVAITCEPYYNAVKQENKKWIRFYINGEIAAFGVISGNAISQLTPQLLKFNGDGCAFDLYNIRYYKKYLSAFQIMQTRTMDLNASVINDTFNKNNFYTPNGDDASITVDKAVEYGKYLASKGQTEFGVVLTTNLCNPTFAYGGENDPGYYNNTDEVVKRKEHWILVRFKQNENGNGIIDIDKTIWLEAVTDGALRFRRQGSSTKKSTKGNVRIDVKGDVRVHKWNGTQFEDNYVTIKKGAKPFEVGNTYPCELLTMKKNPNESTQGRNLPTAKMYEDYSKYLASYNNGTEQAPEYKYLDLLTPPQRAELKEIKANNETKFLTHKEQINLIKTRQCVDGFPALVFEIRYNANFNKPFDSANKNQSSFGGQFDLITDKTNMDVFGFANGDYSLEWRSNSEALCLFHHNNLSLIKDTEQFEYRFPKDTPTVHNEGLLDINGPIQNLFNFVCQCNCHDGYIGKRFFTGEKHGEWEDNGGFLPNGTIDNKNNRKQYFHDHLGEYVVLNQILFNAIMIDDGLMCDQDCKNQFFTCFGNKNGEADTKGGRKVLRLLGYDFDSSWGMDNDNLFKFSPTPLYTDPHIYDGEKNENYPEAVIPSVDMVKSAFWELVFDCFKSEIEEIREVLYKGNKLTVADVLKYMHENQISVYNALQYNANAEYSYSTNSADYEKAHGSALEHNKWFVEGRLYFKAGMYWVPNVANNYNADSATFNVSSYASLDDSNKNYNQKKEDGTNRNWEIICKSNRRTYVYLAQGNSYYKERGAFIDPNNEKGTSVTAEQFQAGSGDVRPVIYGTKYLRECGDLSPWYISKITSWGNLFNLEKLILGHEEPWYKNTALTDLGLSSTNIFVSCKVLNLAGCVAFDSNLDLSQFPILEEFIGSNMPTVTQLNLPEGNNLKVIKVSNKLQSLNLINKTNVTTFDIEGTDNLTSIDCENCSNYLATKIIDLL